VADVWVGEGYSLARVLEHQGKDLLRPYGMPTPAGQVARSSDEARIVSEQIGYPVVVKDQVFVGERGKAWGIQIVEGENQIDQAV
jgi:succinyl-CoA synthetase beta subunit